MSLKAPTSRFASGDTLIEVVIAMTIFSSLAVMALHTMNSGLYQAERAVEITMARNEIDAQAEAIRFVQNNYTAEINYPKDGQQYSELWNQITNLAINSSDFKSANYDINDASVKTCDDAYSKQVQGKKAFAINPRLIVPNTVITSPVGGKDYKYLVKNHILITGSKLKATSVYPRGIYGLLNDGISDGSGTENTNEGKLAETRLFRRAISFEGVWVVAVRGDTNTGSVYDPNRGSQFYDFYIRSCWQATGTKAPSTLTTIVRLYNPGVSES